jgi:hypothetical protein
MSMRDWKAMARASGIPISGMQLDSVTQPLESLEEVFRPLANDLPPDLEPVLEMFVEADFE